MPAGLGRIHRRLALGGLLAGVVALLLIRAGFRAPGIVETGYTGGVYPRVLAAFSWVTGLVPFAVAEMLVAGALGLLAFRLVRRVSRRPGPVRPASGSSRMRQIGALAFLALAGAGTLYAVFVAIWGLNYARPRLEPRLGLPTGNIEGAELARFAAQSAAETTRLHRRAGLPDESVSESPLGFRELSRLIDIAYDEIALPGDPRTTAAVPVKPVVLSKLMSLAGLSGIFIPFTGEPLVNTGPPDVAITFTAAHEKAHQRAITHEGEANFAAYLALSRPRSHPWLRYAASFYATRNLIVAAAPEDRERALAQLGAGPRRDLEAQNAFWAQHRGLVRGAARRVNDTYLRTMRVAGGARSYGTVVRLLVGRFRERERPVFEVTDDRD